MLLGNGGDVADGCWIHDCWFKGNNAKTCTIGISAEIKNSVIENNVINGCITGIDFATGVWFNNSEIKNNKITNVTNGIAIFSDAVATESSIHDNLVIGSSTSIVNSSTNDVAIYHNYVKPTASDSGAAEGDNTTLS